MKKLNLVKTILMFTIIILCGSMKTALAAKVDGFTAINDYNLAKQFAPKFIIDDSEYGNPIALYYRMSKDDKGNTYIAYHPTWEKEVNEGKGILPAINRNIYTGGLSLQRYIFGKGDVEGIEILLNSEKKVTRISFETAKDYNAESGIVNHQKVVLTENLDKPLVFHVMSWNHLFNKNDSNNGAIIEVQPEYFTEKLWNEYEMIKTGSNPFKKDRAFFKYERDYVK